MAACAALTLAEVPPSRLELSVSQAVRKALEHGPELAVVALEPEILDTVILEERAVFDPSLTLLAGREQVVGRDLSAGGTLFDYRTDDLVGEMLLTKPFATGTTVELGAHSIVEDQSQDGQQLVEARLGVTVRQPLLGGAWPSANLGRVQAARHAADAARWGARAFAEELAVLVEQTCWDLALAEAHIALLEASVDDARALLAEIEEGVASGARARTDRAAAESEIALRGQELVETRMRRDVSELTLAGYLSPQHAGRVTERLSITDALHTTEGLTVSVESLVASAMVDRPDLAAARALVRRGEVEVSRARNGLLPRLDVWAEAAQLGYGDDYSQAWDDVDSDHWRFSAGIAFEQFLARRDGRADYRRELLRRRQAQEAARAVEERVATEVRLAHAQVRRWLEAAAAVSATRALDEEKLRVETERFHIGRASSFQVARAQRDLIERRLEEVEALAEHRKALAELYRAAGQSLTRHGVSLDSGGGPAEEP